MIQVKCTNLQRPLCSFRGHPEHFDYITAALRERYPPDQLHIFAARRNRGNLTYDGVELGGERVAREIEDYLSELVDADAGKSGSKGDGQDESNDDNDGNDGDSWQRKERGKANDKLKLKLKFSVVGYSLGGLVARYAIGLLYARGYFSATGAYLPVRPEKNNQDGEQTIQVPVQLLPTTFTTFGTPHVGVRNPTRRRHLWNVVGARTLSISGRQLFLIDSFTGPVPMSAPEMVEGDSVATSSLTGTRATTKTKTGAGDDSRPQSKPISRPLYPSTSPPTQPQPLLALMADPSSVFFLGLASFSRCIAYGNIVNDLATSFYTTCISKSDPFAFFPGGSGGYGGGGIGGWKDWLKDWQVNYVKGYEPVVIDRMQYFRRKENKHDNGNDVHALVFPHYSVPTRQQHLQPIVTPDFTPHSLSSPPSFLTAFRRLFTTHLSATFTTILTAITFLLAALITLPRTTLGTLAFLANSAVQTVLSRRRIRAHYAYEWYWRQYYYRGGYYLGVEREDSGRIKGKKSGNEEQSDKSQISGKEEEEEEGEGEEEMAVWEAQRAMEGEDGSDGSDEEGDDDTRAVRDDENEQQYKDKNHPPSSTVEAATSSFSSSPPSPSILSPPPLSLTPTQFAIIDNLSSLRWHAHPVYIHLHAHSHAAMIVRVPGPTGTGPHGEFAEGRLVVGHWLDREFVG